MATDNLEKLNGAPTDKYITKSIEDWYYTTGLGIKLRLRPVNPIVIGQMQNDQTGKPAIPMVETLVGPKKQKHTEPNPDDPEYKEALEKWQAAKYSKFIRYIFTRGVETDPSKEDRERLREFFPGVSLTEIKYNWVAEQLVDDTEIAILTEAIIGINMATKGGIEEAEARFQGDS